MWSKRDICYFCNSKLRWTDITLADGCTVPACGDCFAGIEKGKKIAEQRGFYDPNKIRGGDKMKVEVTEDYGLGLVAESMDEWHILQSAVRHGFFIHTVEGDFPEKVFTFKTGGVVNLSNPCPICKGLGVCMNCRGSGRIDAG